MEEKDMTTAHKQMIDDLYAQCSQEQKEKYDKQVGIYAIYCNDSLVYIGKSTNLLNRWIAHKCHVFCPESKEYNRPMYAELRRAYNLGCNISINLLEYCNIDELETREDEWIGKYVPALNSIIPKAGGGHYKKPVGKIC